MKDSPCTDTMGIMYEKRPLKRPRLGPPDVYPQEPRQKEDELTSTNVKHGFSTTPQSSDEFGTARNLNYSASKIGQFFSSILSKKEELNTLPDCGRKRQQVNPKDNFWPATARTKAQIEAWFKDLAGSKPLSQLAKKAPNFNKKEEIFITLTEFQVSMPRAAWFIKLSSAYTVAVSEAKIKKRQLPDPTTEWTTTLIKFLKDQIPKLAEHYQSAVPGNVSDKTPPSQSGQGTPSHNSSGNPPGSSTPNSSTVPNSMHSPGNSSTLGSATPGPEGTDWRQALKLWNYCCRLAKYLLDEGLLDRHDFLTWIIELLDKRPPDDGLLRLFLPLALQHMCDFVCCEGLSRRLATSCAKKAAAICSVLSETTLRTLNQPAVFNKQPEQNTAPMSPAADATSNDVKPNISQIKRSATPAEQNQGTPTAPIGTPNPTLGTPNPMGTPNPPQPMDIQVKEEADSPPRDTKTTLNTVIAASLNPVQVGFGEILNCAYHRDVIIQLATVLQIICIECPAAMVWSGCGSHLAGSPLDLLPLPPSALPMPHMESAITEEHRRMIYEAEQEIAARSKKAESKWCTDKWQTSSQARVLAVLEALDRHCFDRVDPNNNLDTLYKEVFANCTSPPKDSNGDAKDQEWPCSYAVVKVLCEWAVCGARWGEHRAMAAAALLDKRQQQLLHQHHEHQGSDDKESISSGAGLYNGPPIFQNLLLRFLDSDAPVLDETPNAPPGNRQQFANLVHLFGELIRRDVFSHDAYMCTLISRGDLISPTEPTSSGGSAHTVAPPANSTGTNHNMDDDIFIAGIDLKPKMEENVRMDLDDSKIDDDLDKLLQHIKEDQQNSMDAPDSPKDPGEPSHSVNSPMMGPGGMSIPSISMGMGPMSVPGMRTTSAGGSSAGTSAPVSRHYHYTMHFPLPPAEPDHTPHDANQRHILLYGVGRQRDDAKHAVKKMTKEICKLFSKKFSIDVAEGGKIKKHSRSEFNFEAVTQKFQAMSMYEQGAVSWAVGGAVCETLAAFSGGATTYLPQPEHVAFALDLCEIALNVHGLIDTCIQILKELSEVEGALISRGAPSSGLAAPRAYTSALALYTVGALRRYHSCLLLCVEQTSAVFEQLCRLVKCVVNPGDCGSAERCVLAQLHDLYKAAAHLCHAPHADTFANAYPKIKQALYSPLQPTPSNYVYNPQFLSEFFTNPRKGKIEIAWARQVAESPANRYSFVCSAMLAVCREVDNDRVNELGVVCAEMTAWCGALAAEWLGALVALCGAQHYPAAPLAPPPLYPDLLLHRDLHDAAAHDALAVFTCILVARHCFSLEDFVRHAALPSLLKACGSSGVTGNPANAPSPDTGARLTCHLLLRLFKTVDTPQPGLYSVSTSPGPGGGAAGVRLSCDRHLLAAAHKNIGVGPVLATLKAILMVGDSTARDSGKPGGKKSCELSHILGTSDTGPTDSQLDLMSGSGGVGSTLLDSSQSLSSLARRVLAEICSEEWVLQKCLQNPDELYQPDMLLDSMLTTKQAQRLLHMICYPDSASHTHPDLDQKTMITRLLENLEQWSLRMSWLDLQLMFKQFPSGSSELAAWLDTVSRAVINVFQQPAPPPPDKDRMGTERGVVSTSKWSESVWLVAPLVAKLPAAVQGRVLKQAGQILESGWGAGCSGNCSSGSGGGGGSHRDCKSHQSPSYKGASSGGGGKRGVAGGACGGACQCGGGSAVRLASEPLLSLVLTCLRHQDDQKEQLLSSIHAQLQHYLTHARDHERSACNDTWQDDAAPEALQLRFSLAGGMFDAIRRSYQLTSDWAVLLTQLIAHQVVDAYNNSLCRSNLFNTLIDMLATLIHSTLADGGDDNNRKHYQNLMKKLKKEIGDRHGPSVQSVRQLLPLSKNTIIEVIACEPLGCLVDQKGNKITGFDSDKKQGLRLTDKQRVSSWELVEGGRNPAPLSWAWFAATKVERKPMTYENAHRLLRYHTHSLVKPLKYYLEPLPLPPEELESADSKQEGGSLEGSPAGAGKGRPRPAPCKKIKKQKPTTPTNGAGVAGGPAGATGGMAPAQPQQPQFMQQQWFPPPGQTYYTPQAGVSPRSVVPPANTQSKQALSNMLRQRLPFNQMNQMQSGGYPGAPHPRAQFPRQGMRQMQPNQMGQMQPNQMNPMGAMGGMAPMNQMSGVQMGPGQMGAGQMSAGQMGGGQMGAGQMGGGQMNTMGGQMFAGQYGGMQQGYGGYGQQMMQGGQQQMMNQGMGQNVNQMAQQVNPMAQNVNSIGQNVGQMNQGVGQGGQMPQSMGQMSQGMGQMQPMGQMGQMVQGGGMGGMNNQTGAMGPQGGNAMGGFPGQQSFQQNMMGGRASQEAYMAQQRQNARPQYNMQAPNVTMGGMGGPAPPYPRGMQPQQSAQYQQMTQQQRLRQQQMLAMQQQGPLVQHLQRQQYQPPY